MLMTSKEDTITIFRPYITRGGKRIYRPGGGMWKLEIPASKYKG